MKIKDFLKNNWWLLALVLIFIFSYHIRAVNIIDDRILSFDPTFQYRFTRYFADWGFFPAWDELTYYVGRPINSTLLGPFMAYITTLLFILLKPFGFSLVTTASYAAAIYGAAITLPAFLLGRELSNEYGGLLSAFLIGTAPQILIRTFGSSYDTDQIALFFIVMTLYLGIYLWRKKDVKSFTLAFIGFTAFMLAWGLFVYSFLIVAFAVLVYLILTTIVGEKKWSEHKLKMGEKFKHAFKDFKSSFLIFLGLFASLTATGYLLKMDTINSLTSMFGFAQNAEAWIVNISIAELQPFNIFNLEGWMLATGRFITGQSALDNSIFLIFIALMTFGLYATYKKDLKKTSFLLTLLMIGVYTTFRGMRFTEFTSALFLILVGVGFGYFVDYCKKDNFLKIISLGLGLSLIFIAAGISMPISQQLGPDINANWDNAWTFIKEDTAQDSIVGTWWDPGHMISALGERRNFADGAHCPDACMYTINDRIVDLGKIMATSNEQEALQLIKKYQGTSSEVYWIASDDLVGKFRWLQYFGTGCDGTTDPSCPLYMQVGRSNIVYSDSGYPQLVEFQDIKVILGNIPVPIYVQGKTAAVVQEVIFYDQEGNVNHIDLSANQTIQSVKELGSQLGYTIADDIVPITVYVPANYGAITIIPQTLRNAVFTKMFFLEGKGLEHFKQVFRNEQVKIYEVV